MAKVFFLFVLCLWALVCSLVGGLGEECMLVFPSWTKAGENDVFEQMRVMISLSSSWGCAAAPPAPYKIMFHMVLTTENASTWEKYVRYPVPGVLHGSEAMSEATFAVNEPRSVLEEMLTRYRVLRLDNVEAKLAGRFWPVGLDHYTRLTEPTWGGSFQGGRREEEAKMTSTSSTRELLSKQPSFPLFPSDLVVEAAESVSGLLNFDYVAVKIRRGDMLRHYKAECVPSPLKVAQYLKPFVGKATTLFVLVQPLHDGKQATEQDALELKQFQTSLTDALRGSFDRVVFESQVTLFKNKDKKASIREKTTIPSLKDVEDDPLFNFLVSLRVAHGASVYVVVSPKYSKFKNERPPIDDLRRDCQRDGVCRADEEDPWATPTALEWLQCDDSPSKQVAGLVVKNPKKLYTYKTVVELQRDLVPLEKSHLQNISTKNNNAFFLRPDPHLLAQWVAAGYPATLSTFSWPGHVGG